MNRPTKLVLSVLSLTALLTACADGITQPRTSPGDRRDMAMDQMDMMDQPYDPYYDGGGYDPYSGGGGTTTTTAPFAPPPPPFIFASNLPLYIGGPGGVQLSCGQVTHAFWGFSNDVTAGTVIYVTGVVVPNTRMNWGIYNQAGQLVRTHLTQPARSNCVVHHEPEGVSTAGLAPGYYYLYASYNGLSNFPPFESSFGYVTGIQGKYVGALRVR